MQKNILIACNRRMLSLARLFIILPLVCLMSGFTVSGADRQDVSSKKISIALKDVTLRSALNKISDVADISFVYVNSQALDKSKVSITAHNEPVGVLLKKLLTPHSFSYTVVDDRIIIRHNGEKGTPAVSLFEACSPKVYFVAFGNGIAESNIIIMRGCKVGGTISATKGRQLVVEWAGNALR